MAQDLLADPIHRAAVALKPNGFYTVDYAMLEQFRPPLNQKTGFRI
jgi:hypothetical protein